MLRKQALLNAVASERYSRQIISLGAGNPVFDNGAGAGSISVPWPTTAGSVAANVITFLVLGLKPGTANLGNIPTPAGWTLVGSHIGGGYGGTLGVDTGNTRIFLFSKENDNTSAGSLAVSLTPDGGNGVACGNMVRLEKRSGTWQPVVVSTAESTANSVVGTFPPSPDMMCSRGDWLIYGFAITQRFLGGTVLLAGDNFYYANPNQAIGATTQNGFKLNTVSWGMRAGRGGLLPNPQTHTILDNPGVINRGPMIVARYRVR